MKSTHLPEVAGAIATVTGSLDIDLPSNGVRQGQSFSVSPAEALSLDFLAVDGVLSADGKTLTIRAWKPTASGDVTPIAATDPKKVAWMVFGK